MASRCRGNTIGCYLSGLKYFAAISGVTLPTKDMPLLKYTLRGIKRANIKTGKPPKDPITMAHLRKILWYLRNSVLPVRDRRMWWAVCLVAFYGLLRSAEYCSHSRYSYYPESTLALEDMVLSEDYIIIHIRHSKTDPFHAGQSVTLGATYSEFCPVSAMRAFLTCRGLQAGPLFTFSNGSLLTRIELSKFLTLCFPSILNINTHSFRIGGASALAQAGVPDYVIQSMGRWKSNCFLIYLRFPEGYRKSLTVRMANPGN